MKTENTVNKFAPTFNYVGTTSSELFNRRSNIVTRLLTLVKGLSFVVEDHSPKNAEADKQGYEDPGICPAMVKLHVVLLNELDTVRSSPPLAVAVCGIELSNDKEVHRVFEGAQVLHRDGA